MESVEVIVPWFGNQEVWEFKAERALRSAFFQTTNCRGRISSGSSLSEARNAGAELSTADWLIFLDADDELDPNYIESMLEGSGDLRWPSTIGVVDGVEDDFAVLLQPKGSLLVHNWMVIGTMLRREMFIGVGGFRDLPMLEDWDLWIRCVMAGAQPSPCENAIYRVHVNKNSRNSGDHPYAGSTYSEIQNRYRNEWLTKFGGL